MVKRSELQAKIKEKILLIGETGTGKTFTSAKVANFVAGHGKKVVFIDPERGAGKELEMLSDEVLENIEFRDTPEWDPFKKAIFKNDNCFLKVVDGLSEAFVSSKIYLEDRYVAHGKYMTGKAEAEIEITDKEIFTLPFVAYSKVYDFIIKICHELVKQSPHIIVTMHSFGGSEAKQRLEADVFRKFDIIFELRRTPKTTPPSIVYDAVLKKRRGRPFKAFYAMPNYVEQLEKLFAKRMGIEYGTTD